jgi:hypothetical protein
MNKHTRSGFPSVVFILMLSACTGEDKTPKSENTVVDTIVTSTLSTDEAQMQVQPASAAVTDPNPAHGEPGHRCEIPVGASLSSAPAAGAAAPPTTSPMFNPATLPTATTGTPSITAPGMNPPHGEPGHDCNVAVGSPLPK